MINEGSYMLPLFIGAIMETKTISNAKELTIAVLEQFAVLFSHTFEGYTYSVQQNGTIIIFNPDNDKCMEISDTEITMRDIIQDAFNDAFAEELVKIRQKEVDSFMDIFDGLSDFGKVKVHAEPSISYKSFLYFDKQEVWNVAMDTDTPDVLPFETSDSIKKIKEAVLKDLAKKWTTV